MYRDTLMNETIDFNELFNDSYEYIVEDSEIFFSDFYQFFLTTSPEVREAFKNTDMPHQKMMLRGAIVFMINFFVTKTADSNLINIGIRHKEILKIEPHLYELFMDSLLLSLKKNYPRYTEKCGLAWRITLSPGLEFMKHCSKS